MSGKKLVPVKIHIIPEYYAMKTGWKSVMKQCALNKDFYIKIPGNVGKKIAVAVFFEKLRCKAKWPDVEWYHSENVVPTCLHCLARVLSYWK